ncbi:BQ2448_4379 [Microbotryum intermedium]|uniref:BQ2448_4379 protein n=1 Tax=Microbotryum intermedium TaxID=269621 RepID=A0A238FGA4_9BASI|nr:BQ2448_4379 [Microbotryum intermedium]
MPASLSNLVHGRAIDVPANCPRIDHLQDISLTSARRERSSYDKPHYIYCGPNDFTGLPLSVLDDVLVKCSLRQSVLSSIKLSVDHLLALCRTHGVEGYCARSRAKELFNPIRRITYYSQVMLGEALLDCREDEEETLERANGSVRVAVELLGGHQGRHELAPSPRALVIGEVAVLITFGPKNPA